MLSYYLPDEKSLEKVGSQLSKVCPKKIIIFLEGELGAGKTTFSRGFLQGLGYTGAVKSPTYALVESYNIKGIQLFHFDFYRVTDPKELEYRGVHDYFSQEAICLLEWPAHVSPALPSPDLHCFLKIKKEGREMELVAKSEKGEKVLVGLEVSL